MFSDAYRIWARIPVALVTMAFAGNVLAADLVEPGYGVVPAPETTDQIGIWGAIAFSEGSGEYGIFWGADKRGEAEDIAVKHCEKRSSSPCELVLTYRNHRHWDDDDGSGFPYNYCAALAVKYGDQKNVVAWGVASAKGRRDAERQAVAKCGPDGSCKILEAGCT